jgi:lysophospholipase L1-like esterase
MRRQLFNNILIALIISSFVTLFAQDLSNVTPDPDPNRFKEAVDYFKWYDSRNSSPADAVLFVGSSSIRLWETAKYFPDFPIINRGFGGSHISDVIFFIEPFVMKYKPQVIVFYAGDNDVADKKSAEQVFNDYKEFFRLVKRELPDTKILYIPIKPSLDRWSIWEEMKKANDLISMFSEKYESLYYIDMATPMLSEDSLPDSSLFVEDGLHLNTKGYELWTEILMPVLENTYKERE